jgi:hypothetical protein
MARHTRFKRLLGGIAAAVALMFVAAPVATASADDTKTTSSKVSQRDTGWGR